MIALISLVLAVICHNAAAKETVFQPVWMFGFVISWMVFIGCLVYAFFSVVP